MTRAETELAHLGDTPVSEKALSVRCITLERNITRLMKVVGEAGECRSCGREIRFFRHRASNLLVPYDLDGTPHMATCPESAIVKAREKQESLFR